MQGSNASQQFCSSRAGLCGRGHGPWPSACSCRSLSAQQALSLENSGGRSLLPPAGATESVEGGGHGIDESKEMLDPVLKACRVPEQNPDGTVNNTVANDTVLSRSVTARLYQVLYIHYILFVTNSVLLSPCCIVAEET